MKKKLVENYTNRYRDKFTFTYDPKVNPDLILWEGNFKYCRYGWENNVKPEDNVFSMVDPSGGPYISSGMESNLLIPNLKGLYVDYLSMNGTDADKPQSINIHLKPISK